MKYLVGIFIVMFVTVCSLEAQVPAGLKGPAAKNYKPWMDKNKKDKRSIVSIPSKKALQGPEAKNFKPWANKEDWTPAVPVSEAKPKLKGPAAKNYKPWKD